ncbi:MAG TPA: ATP-binding protein [Cyclobacteriaceae bacterium]|jgi:signal transduction histidine kinase/DNA-binding response OmpR family regulator|nr:ATP-binding protein [Cyclobacteriaceae bacterium]
MSLRLFFLFSVISIHGLYAQVKITDSLIVLLNNYPANDTGKVSLLNNISTSAWGADPKLTKQYAGQALLLSQELNYTKGIADSYAGISRYYWTQTEYDQSTNFALKALKEYEQIHNLKGVSWCYASIGTNYSQANNFDKAIYYHNRALALNKKINNLSGVGRNLNSLGYINELQKNYPKALEYYKRGLDIRLTVGNKVDITLSYANVGSIYYLMNQYSRALEFLFKALPLAQAVDNKNYIALIYQNIGEVYYKTGKYDEGERYLLNALQLGNEIGDKKRREGVYDALKSLEQSRGNYKAAFHYLELLQGVRDTLYTQDRSRQVAKMETLYETNKKEQTIKLLEQQRHIQLMWRYALSFGIILVMIATLIIYRLQQSRARKTKQLLVVEQALNDKLKEVDKLKSRFFANISHEFRTPLTLLLAPIEEKLSSNNISNSEKDLLMLMRRNANRLLDLVNQLLDLSKLEVGKMGITLRKYRLKEFMNTIAASFNMLAENKKIHFEKKLIIPDGSYSFDADILEKIINNLLSNAFKFTPPGGLITLMVEMNQNSSGIEDGIKIKVSDTGKGIPRDEQNEIFSPFYQIKNLADDGNVGTGLGLSLVKELTKLYGGSVNLISTENLGTSVTVYIPLDPAVKESAPLEPEARLVATLKNQITESGNDTHEDEPEELHDDIILVVEDNADLRNFISSVLQKEFTVVCAADGKDGFEQALHHIPALIISDLMMPVMDGLILTEKIKSDERTSHIPVVLLTAKNEQESKLEGLRTGADDYLTKPFSTEELRVRIINLIEQRRRLAAKYGEQNAVIPTPLLKHEMSLEEKFLQKARTIVESNINDFAFGVETLSAEMHLSRTQLLRKLKALTGLSPNEFIKDLRLKRAAELILSKADTISQIGYAVGFNDQSYFTKCFKKQFGVAPSEYGIAEKV